MTSPSDARREWWALELAFGHVVRGHHSFFERETGRLVVAHAEEPRQRQLLDQLAVDPRYVRIDPVSSQDQYGWMVRFLPLVGDPLLHDRLKAAIAGPGAFRAFKDVLEGRPEREEWFSFRKQQLREHIVRWLEDHGLVGDVGTSLHPKALRKTAYALIEMLPANELASAVAFLMHLSARQPLDDEKAGP